MTAVCDKKYSALNTKQSTLRTRISTKREI